MSERKVLNKYFPPNFDPSKIPKRIVPKDKQHIVRLMTPFSMRCNTCGEYIYKGRKFNARKETVESEMYLTIKIYRFYIRCPMCGAEITYKTDPKNTDYVAELGATRNFEPWREELREGEDAKKKRFLEELHNPMKALENKTYDSKREIDIVEGLDEIRTVNARLDRVDTDRLFVAISEQADIERIEPLDVQRRREQEEREDEELIKRLFRSKPELVYVEEEDDKDTIPSSLGPGHPQKSAWEQEHDRLKRRIEETPVIIASPTIVKGKRVEDKRKLDSSILGIVPKKRPP